METDPSRPRQRAARLARGGGARLRAQSAAGRALSGPLRRARIHLALPGHRPARFRPSRHRLCARRDDRRIQVAEAVPRRVPQPCRLPRGRDRRHRPAARRRDEAALAAHRRLLVSARRHSDRRLLADRRAARGPVGPRPGRRALSRAGAEPWPCRTSPISSSTAPARSAAMSAAPGSPPGSTSPSSAARRSSRRSSEHGLALSDPDGWAVKFEPDRIQFDTSQAALRKADIVLLCVKSTGTEAAAKEIARHVRKGAAVISFQNGISNADTLRAPAAQAGRHPGAWCPTMSSGSAPAAGTARPGATSPPRTMR